MVTTQSDGSLSPRTQEKQWGDSKMNKVVFKVEEDEIKVEGCATSQMLGTVVVN